MVVFMDKRPECAEDQIITASAGSQYFSMFGRRRSEGLYSGTL